VLVPTIVRILVPAGMPGVYLLGRVDKLSSSFVPHYVGRSDFDVRERLTRHEKMPLATHFYIQMCSSAEEAFTKECFYWHILQDEELLTNRIHPDSPSRVRLQCPYCSASKHFNKYILGHISRLVKNG
jgi:hypothetical protein